MWLLTARWSTPRKPLLPSRQDDQTAADSLRPLRWPHGAMWPRCGRAAVESRERGDKGRQRCHWGHCAARLDQQLARFTAWPSAIFEESTWRPLDWWLGLGLGPLTLNATAMAAAAESQERTAQRCSHLLAGGLDATDHLAPSRPLEHPGEADECAPSAGSQGLPREVERRDRAPRARGMPLRGRATAETGRPPILGWVQRRDKAAPAAPAAPGSLAVREHVRTAAIKPIMTAKVPGGAPGCPEQDPISPGTAADSAHRTVNHGAGAYARREPAGACGPCHTMAGLWSGRRNVLDRFTGISQRFLHLRVGRDECLHNHGPLPWRQTCEAALRCIFSTPGDYLRRRAHQHRCMPLTLCYR
jgi:hypothetical protein